MGQFNENVLPPRWECSGAALLIQPAGRPVLAKPNQGHKTVNTRVKRGKSTVRISPGFSLSSPCSVEEGGGGCEKKGRGCRRKRAIRRPPSFAPSALAGERR